MYSSSRSSLPRNGKPVPISACSRLRLVADPDAAAVQLGADAATGGEQLLAHRIVDHRVFQPALDFGRQRHREHREAVEEVGGAVERIDDPQRVGLAAGAASLRRETRGPGDCAGWCSMISRSAMRSTSVTKSLRPLVRDPDAVQPVDIADDDVASAASGADADIEERIHGIAWDVSVFDAGLRVLARRRARRIADLRMARCRHGAGA